MLDLNAKTQQNNGIFGVKSFDGQRQYDNETRNMVESFCTSTESGYDYNFPYAVTFSSTIQCDDEAQFNKHITIDTNYEVRFRDTGSKLYSGAANQLNLDATVFALNAETKVDTTKKIKFFDDDVYVQAVADGKLKLSADTEIHSETPLTLIRKNMNFATTTNVGNAYSLGVQIADLANGRFVMFICNAASTGAATLNVYALGARKMLLGSDNSTQVTVELVANGCYWAMYSEALDGGSGAWVVMNI